MKIICANVGSTSFKYQILDHDLKNPPIVKGAIERIGNPPSFFQHTDQHGTQNGEIEIGDHLSAVRHVIEKIGDFLEIGGVGFKAVFAKGYWRSAIIDENVINALEEYTPLAPVHNPAYIAAIRAFQKHLPRVPLIAVFETWFHQSIPDHAADFGVPRSWIEKHGVRRYGFHGASHRWISERVPKMMNRSAKDLKIISCHLGGSSSICAIRNGKSIDTSMGMSPQSGVLQSTRSGNLDPFSVLYIMKKENLTVDQIIEILMSESGLRGISEMSSDLRDLGSAAERDHVGAKLALDAYFYGIKKYIGSYVAVLGGADAIAFTGGIGEKSRIARRSICNDLEWLGIKIDPKKNSDLVGEGEISTVESRVKIFVISANEEAIIARETARVIGISDRFD